VTSNVGGVSVTVRSEVFNGLKDKTIEAKVNKKIADKLEDLKKYSVFDNLPVYPGFYAAYPNGFQSVRRLAIGADQMSSFNNILSLRLYVLVTVSKHDYAHDYDFIIYDTLNLDLNTGEELNLADLFVNGSDYVSALNDAVLLKSQSQTDPVSNGLEYFVDTYRYIGGFTGIRGDVKFHINDNRLYLTFNENYPEFINDFTTTEINFPLEDFKDILAIGQRCVHEGTWLYTDPVVSKIRNYLYPSHLDITYEKIHGMVVRSEIVKNDTLSDFYKTLRDNLIQADKQTIAAISDPNAKNVWYTFNAYPTGIYMNVYSTLYVDGSFLKGVITTYKPDGNKITFDDLFVDGFDYRTYFKNDLANQIKLYEFQNTYDLDTVLDSMIPTLQLMCIQEECHLWMTNEYVNDFTLDEGDFGLSLSITYHPEYFKIKPWLPESY